MFADDIVICSEVERYALKKRGMKVSQHRMERVEKRGNDVVTGNGEKQSGGEDFRVNSPGQRRVCKRGEEARQKQQEAELAVAQLKMLRLST